MAINFDVLSGTMQMNTKPWEQSLSRAGASMQEFQKKANAAMKAIQSGVGNAAKALSALTAGLVAIGKKSIDSYREAEQGIKKMEVVLKATGGSVGFTSKQLQGMASEIQKLTNFEDDAVIAAQKMLLQFKSVRGDIFKDAIHSAADLATIMGTGIPQATRMLGMALEDPGRGMDRLRRAGVILTKQEKERVAVLAKQGKHVEAQAAFLEAIASRVGGAAAAVRDPWIQFGNQMGEVFENIGKIIKPRFDELATRLRDTTISVVEWIDANRELLGMKLDEYIAKITDGVKLLWAEFRNMPPVVQALIGGLAGGMALQKIGGMIPMLGGFISAIGALINPVTILSGLMTVIAPLFTHIGAGIALVVASIAGFVDGAMKAIKASDTVQIAWKAIRESVQRIGEAIMDFGTRVWERLKLFWEESAPKIEEVRIRIAGLIVVLASKLQPIIEWLVDNGLELLLVAIDNTLTGISAVITVVHALVAALTGDLEPALLIAAKAYSTLMIAMASALGVASKVAKVIPGTGFLIAEGAEAAAVAATKEAARTEADIMQREAARDARMKSAAAEGGGIADWFRRKSAGAGQALFGMKYEGSNLGFGMGAGPPPPAEGTMAGPAAGPPAAPNAGPLAQAQSSIVQTMQAVKVNAIQMFLRGEANLNEAALNSGKSFTQLASTAFDAIKNKVTTTYDSIHKRSKELADKEAERHEMIRRTFAPLLGARGGRSIEEEAAAEREARRARLAGRGGGVGGRLGQRLAGLGDLPNFFGNAVNPVGFGGIGLGGVGGAAAGLQALVNERLAAGDQVGALDLLIQNLQVRLGQNAVNLAAMGAGGAGGVGARGIGAFGGNPFSLPASNAAYLATIGGGGAGRGLEGQLQALLGLRQQAINAITINLPNARVTPELARDMADALDMELRRRGRDTTGRSMLRGRRR